MGKHKELLEPVRRRQVVPCAGAHTQTGTCSPTHATSSAQGLQGCTAGWARGWALTAPHAAVAAAAVPTAALR